MTVDLTQLSLAIVAGIFGIIKLLMDRAVNANIKSQQAAATVSAALDNSLGALQQATEALAKGEKPINVPLPIANVPPGLTIGVQYVLDHAGDEAKQIGLTPEAIADKINARIGKASIASNIAAAGSDAPTPAPLAVVPVGAVPVAPAKVAT